MIASEFSQRDHTKHFFGNKHENPGARVDCTICYDMMRSMFDIAHTGVGSKSLLGLEWLGHGRLIA